MKPPKDSERICILSFEVARTLLAGGPDTRPSFWKVYRTELALNLRTSYDNYHIRVCRPVLAPLMSQLEVPYFFRGGKLVIEKPIKTPTPSPNAHAALSSPAP